MIRQLTILLRKLMAAIQGNGDGSNLGIGNGTLAKITNVGAVGLLAYWALFQSPKISDHQVERIAQIYSASNDEIRKEIHLHRLAQEEQNRELHLLRIECQRVRASAPKDSPDFPHVGQPPKDEPQ